MPTSQILRGSPATINFTTLDQDGQPRAGGPMTITVKRGDGTALVSDEDTTPNASNQEFSFDLTALQTATLDTLHATWTEDGGASFDTFIEIVGGYFFTLDEARRSAANFKDKAMYPDALLKGIRAAVEEECEKKANRAFVPRARRFALSGNDTDRLWLPDPDVRSIKSISFLDNNGEHYSNNMSIDNLRVDYSGRLFTPQYSFPFGVNNVEIAYECGMDAPPQRIKEAALLRFRDLATTRKSGIDRATYQMIEGKVFNVLQPGVRGSTTGLPDVDAAYEAWSFNRGSVASIPL